MKVVILAGGYGTRLGRDTEHRPKPMLEIGGRPILWHIMKIYESYGFTEFVVCCGHKSEVIKDYFANYLLRQSDLTVDLKRGTLEYHRSRGEPWRVTLVETGRQTMTGGRLMRIAEYVDDETFLLTYGDGLADLDIGALVGFHRVQGCLATVTAVHAPSRFGAVTLDRSGARVRRFREHSPQVREDGWINGGFFVCEPGVLDHIESDDTVWERGPVEELARDGLLAAFRHEGFWHPLDTPGDKRTLEELWRSGDAPWRTW